MIKKSTSIVTAAALLQTIPVEPQRENRSAMQSKYLLVLQLYGTLLEMFQNHFRSRFMALNGYAQLSTAKYWGCYEILLELLEGAPNDVCRAILSQHAG